MFLCLYGAKRPFIIRSLELLRAAKYRVRGNVVQPILLTPPYHQGCLSTPVPLLFGLRLGLPLCPREQMPRSDLT